MVPRNISQAFMKSPLPNSGPVGFPGKIAHCSKPLLQEHMPALSHTEKPQGGRNPSSSTSFGLFKNHYFCSFLQIFCKLVLPFFFSSVFFDFQFFADFFGVLQVCRFLHNLLVFFRLADFLQFFLWCCGFATVLQMDFAAFLWVFLFY